MRVLSIIFFSFAIIGSIFWLSASGVYIESRVGWENLITMNPSDIAFFMTAIFLPITVLWVIIGFIYYAKVINKQLYFLEGLFNQLRGNFIQNDNILKNLINIQESNNNNDILKSLDIAFSDLNNIIAEIAVRFGIMRKTSEDSLWERVSQGNRWAFSQIVLENAEETDDFDEALKKRMSRDEKLSKAVELFLRRFEKIIQQLNLSDLNRPFIDIIEEGELGKLYDRLYKIVNSDKETEEGSKKIPHIEEATNTNDIAMESTFHKALFSTSDGEQETGIFSEGANIDFSPVFDEDEIVTIEISNQKETLKEDTAKESLDYDWEARKKEILAKYSKDKENKEDFSNLSFLKNKDWNN